MAGRTNLRQTNKGSEHMVASGVWGQEQFRDSLLGGTTLVPW